VSCARTLRPRSCSSTERSGFCAVALLANLACQSNTGPLPCEGPPTAAWVVGAPSELEVLAIVDNNGESMVRAQELLGQAVPSFLDRLPNTEVRLQVVTTDTSTGGLNDVGESFGQARWTFSQQSPFEVMDVDLSGCSNPGVPHGCHRGYPAVSARRAVADDLAIRAAEFSSYLRVGSCGLVPEQGLGALMLALDPGRRRECGGSAFDPAATLLVVVMTNSNDESPLSPEAYAHRLFALRPLGRTTFLFILGADNGASAARCGAGIGDACGGACASPPPAGSLRPCDFRTTCPAGESCQPGDDGQTRCQNEALAYWSECAFCSFYRAPGCCEASGGTRYLEFASAYERLCRDGLGASCSVGRAMTRIESICQPSFETAWSQAAIDLVVQAELKPDSCRFSVEADRVAWQEGSIRVDGQALPKDAIEISEDGWLTIAAPYCRAGARITTHPPCG
jgi:hypothetical protein